MLDARVTELAYQDEELASFVLPRETLRVTRGIGSGLTRRVEATDGTVWAVGDRGPNLKVSLAIRRYGLDHLERHLSAPGAKIMPCPEIGPAIVELHVGQHQIEVRRKIALRDVTGQPLSGLPPAESDALAAEPALSIDGEILSPNPGGADTEGLAVAPDGSFWVGEEYGPSLLNLDPDGTVRVRWVPTGTEALFDGANYPVVGALPPLATRRRLNRGFEGLALSTDGHRLHVAFQSPLAHPDDRVGRRGRHVRLWTLDARTGSLVSEHLYPLDKPNSFRRDCELRDVDRADVKLCDMTMVGNNRLLVLERVSATAKLYLVTLDPEIALEARWSDPAKRPTLEEASADGTLDVPVIDKELLFSSDNHPEIGADLEGLTVLDDRTVLLVNDNDFGVEGVATRFWRVEFAQSLQ